MNDDWHRYLGAQATPELYAKRGGDEFTLVEDLKHLWGDPSQGEDCLTDREIEVIAKRMARQLPGYQA